MKKHFWVGGSSGPPVNGLVSMPASGLYGLSGPASFWFATQVPGETQVVLLPHSRQARPS